MQQAIEDFLAYIQVQKHRSEHTLAAYRNDLNQFLKFVTAAPDGVESWQDVGTNLILRYVLDLKERRYAAATVARKVAAVKSFFHHLCESNVMSDDPTATLDSPRVKKRRPKILSQEEVARLLAQPTDQSSAKALRDRAILELLYGTGMRAGELVALTVDDINLASGTVRIRSRREADRQVVNMGPRATAALEAYLEKGRLELAQGAYRKIAPVPVPSLRSRAGPGHGNRPEACPESKRRDEPQSEFSDTLQSPEQKALFLNPWGHPLTRQGLWLIFKGYVEKAGLSGDVSPYTLRHSFARHALDKGTELEDVKEVLGHSSITTTQIYIHLSDKKRDAG